MQWNYDGSLLATINKEKKLSVFDPRALDQAMISEAHAGNKKQSLSWMGSSNNLITHGWSPYNERQWAIYDPRNLGTPVAMKKLDSNLQQAWIHYDNDSHVLYVVNKGHTMTHMFYVSEGGEPSLQALDTYKGNDNQQGMYFMPKNIVNFMDNELLRSIRFNGKVAEYITWKVPRKSGSF